MSVTIHRDFQICLSVRLTKREYEVTCFVTANSLNVVYVHSFQTIYKNSKHHSCLNYTVKREI